MPDNRIFEYRYSIPGYTFMLFFCAVNFNLVLIAIREFMPLESSSATFAGIVLGLVTFLSGIPFGFIISQIWYFSANRIVRPLIIGRAIKSDKKPSDVTLHYLTLKEFGVEERYFDASYNYLITAHSMKSPQNNSMFKYIIKRWDLFNILGSTGVAMLAAIVMGIPVWYYMVNIQQFSVIQNSVIEYYFNRMTIMGIPLHILLVVLVTVFMLYFFYYEMRQIAREHATMIDLMLRDLTKNNKGISDLLPKHFFKIVKNNSSSSAQSGVV